jgi:hypothetical protein
MMNEPVKTYRWTCDENQSPSHQIPDTKKSLAMVLNYTLPRTVETIEQRNHRNQHELKKNETHEFSNEFKAILSATGCYRITVSHLIKLSSLPPHTDKNSVFRKP